MQRNLLLLISSIMLISLLSACGKTGKLYLPDDKSIDIKTNKPAADKTQQQK